MKQETPPISAAASRRHWLTGAVAVGAVAAGAGWAWWRHSLSDAASGVDEAIWQQEFPALAGQPAIRMAALKGQPLLLNFWATWCPPCVEELPLLDTFYRENAAKGWQVLGVAIDRVEAVQIFLRKTSVTFPVAMAGLGGTELGRSFGNQAGGLPFTVVLGADGAVVHRKMGQVTHQDLTAWVVAGSA